MKCFDGLNGELYNYTNGHEEKRKNLCNPCNSWMNIIRG